MTEAIMVIDNATTRDEVAAVLQGLKAKEVKAIADHYQVYIPKPAKADMIERIVSATVGAKIRSESILGIKLSTLF